jgi:hypothetical protein
MLQSSKAASWDCNDCLLQLYLNLIRADSSYCSLDDALNVFIDIDIQRRGEEVSEEFKTTRLDLLRTISRPTHVRYLDSLICGNNDDAPLYESCDVASAACYKPSTADITSLTDQLNTESAMTPPKSFDDLSILLEVQTDLATVSSELIEAVQIGARKMGVQSRSFNQCASSMLNSYMGIVDTAFGNVQIWTAESSDDSTKMMEDMLLNNEAYVGSASDQILTGRTKSDTTEKETLDLQMKRVNKKGSFY